MKFDASVEKLRGRISALRTSIDQAKSRIGGGDRSISDSDKAKLDETIEHIRRGCLDVFQKLKSFVEFAASSRVSLDSDAVKQLHELRREHEFVVDDLSELIKRSRAEVHEHVSAIATSNDTGEIVEIKGSEAASIPLLQRVSRVSGMARGDVTGLSLLELENALDRAAYLSAQNDLLKLRLDRSQKDLRRTAGELADARVSQTEQRRASEKNFDELSAKYDDLQQVASLFAQANHELAERVRKTELLVQYALTDEFELYAAEASFLNPEAFGGAPKKLSKKDASTNVRLIMENELFDAGYYASQFSDKLDGDAHPLTHYLTIGWKQGKDPHPLFSVAYYLMRHQDLVQKGVEPLGHYVTVGSSLKYDPHPLFVTEYYAKQRDASPPEERTWLSDFLQVGPSPPSPSPLFNLEEYARMSGVAHEHTAVALLHYVTGGWRKSGFSALFDVDHYRSQVGPECLIEPYLHFSIYGAAHDVNPHPLFNTRFYLERFPHAHPHDVDPLYHYLSVGESGGVSPSQFFDPSFYRDTYLGGKKQPSALAHYLSEGNLKGRKPYRDFNPDLYRRLVDLPPGIDPIVHFATSGLEVMAAAFAKSKTGQLKTASVTPTKDKNTKVAEKAGAETNPVRHYPGKRPILAGRPNVLVVAHIAGEHLFGSERSFLDMLGGLASVPVNSVVVVPRNVPDYTNAIRALCQHVYVTEYKWWRDGESTSDVVRETFKKLIVDNDITVVHANTIMLREPLEAARACGVASVVHVRELIQFDEPLQTLIGKNSRQIVSETLARADWIIGNSKITASTFEKADCTSVIPNTIDVTSMDVANPIGSREVRFGLISSNIPKKGLADVIELAVLAARKVPNARFVIIGPINEHVEALKKKQQDGEIPDNVSFPGYAKSPLEAVQQVNVVMSFSHFAESFGRTVLEAMAARRPVIAYEWGAVTELIEHQKSGYLVPFRKPEQALKYVEQLCKNPKLIGAMGERGREIALERYGIDSYQRAFQQAYTGILAKAKPVARLPVIKPARLPGLKDRQTNVRVAYFCWHFPVPSETFVLNELEALIRKGVDVRVFCKQIPYKDFKIPFDIEFERVASPEDLARRLKETSRTIVHAHFVYPVVTDMVWPACEQAQIPFTFIAHAQDIFRYDNDKKNRLAEIGASPWCRSMFTLSKFHLEFVAERGFPRDKIIINPNAVDTVRFAANFSADREIKRTGRIIAVHRFVEKKGLDLLIRAAALIKDLDVHIEIYGYGDLEADYRRVIEELALDNVEIKGRLTQDQIIDVMKDVDLFAAPSVRVENGDMDGIPTSVVESMAAGVPVLTTNVAGIPDLVIDGISGIMAEPTVQGVADAIRRFYAMPSLKVRAMINNGAERVRRRHDANRLTNVLLRVWQNATVDIVIVSWNNLTELKMVVDRILANTAMPYHLIICDNQSRKEPVGEYLDELYERTDRLTVIHNSSNAMVGPGTNTAMAEGCSDLTIYICGREGVSFANGWVIPFIHAMDENPEAGLFGTIGYSPTYLYGKLYPTGVRLFDKFRNKQFASDNPDRVFGHVQGGLFGIRRKMFDEIGGFSDDVPHDYTDVEYSYYAESRGWKFSTVPEVLALFNKSRPTLSQRFDEGVVVAHPVLPDELDRYDRVATGKLMHCNVCDWYGESFESECCPNCKSSPDDRSLYRWFSEGIYMYRRLPALGAGLSGEIEKIWSKQFQGQRLAVSDAVAELRRSSQFSNRANSFHLSVVRSKGLILEDVALISKELKRLLMPGAPAVFQIESDVEEHWKQQRDLIRAAMTKAGFAMKPDVIFTSRSVNYSCSPMIVAERLA